MEGREIMEEILDERTTKFTNGDIFRAEYFSNLLVTVSSLLRIACLLVSNVDFMRGRSILSSRGLSFCNSFSIA